MSLAGQIFEITSLPLNYRDRVFYYGVPGAEEARRIYMSGLIPVTGGKKRVPRSYLSGTLPRAASFADAELGGKWNRDRIRRAGRYAYIFVVGPENLEDVYPNPSEIGRFVQQAYELQYGKGDLPLTDEAMAFLSYVWSILERDEQLAVIHQDRESEDRIGQILLRRLPDRMLIWILTHEDVNLSGDFEVSFREVKRVDRGRLHEVDPDGTNFFEVAEDVDSEEDIV